MKVSLQYGTEGLPLDLTGINATVLEPRFVEGLPDEKAEFLRALREPMECDPLAEQIAPGESVAIVIADITRPLPSARLLGWLLEALPVLTPESVTIISGTGSHRANTPEEWHTLVGREVYERFRCVDHNAHDPGQLALAGESPFGYLVRMNRHYVRADRRIILGFIEPHFMAGFSGGYKAVFPGMAGIDAIMRYHGVKNIGHARSTWGVLEDNPTQATVRANGSMLPVDFCINVTLNRRREITRFFCGDTRAAHDAGCAWVRDTVMIPVEQEFPVVITTNSGYPLDQNLYQSVKGMSAAAQVVADDGLIITAARCNDGFPEHGNFRRQLFAHVSPEALLETIYRPGFAEFDQWQTQLFALILKRARIALRSELPDDEVRRAHLEPIRDIRQRLDAELDRIGRDAPVAVLPEGPLTIPFLPVPSP